MTRKLIECVPNISEGRDRSVIDSVVQSATIEGIEVLDVDAGVATNRTVITLVGTPEAMEQAAFNLIKRAAELIDMRQHKGEHPRMGATDVCPFIPIENVEMSECVEIAKRVGKRVAAELQIPIYLYESAAATTERQSLAYLRSGEYEGLAQKFQDPKMAPDFGQAIVNARSGATVIGARPFLIAYNINLNTRSKKAANEIAQKLRESGYKTKDANGNFILGADGQPVITQGRFKNCRAVGWFIEEYGVAQISINLTNFHVTGLHHVFEEASHIAASMGLRVTGSEIVGLLPRQALLESGLYYLEKQRTTKGSSVDEILKIAARSLGLSDVKPFIIKEKVIEERVRSKEKLLGMTLRGFIEELASDSAAPGGGSVAALAGSLAAALAAMVSNLSFTKSNDHAARTTFESWGVEAHQLKDSLFQLVEEDTLAFDQVMKAYKVKDALRNSALSSAYELAITVPLRVMELSLKALKLCQNVTRQGLRSALSDGAVAAQMAYVGMLGASYNVRINLTEYRKIPQNSTQHNQFIETVESKLHNILVEAKNIIDNLNSTLQFS